MRFFCYISYKGTNYHGWQIQPNATTVQAEINKALSTILREDIETIGSGRTDSGVHAKEQVFHAVITDQTVDEKFVKKMNGLLPNDIVVNKLIPVQKEAHARFDAVSRSYEYHILFNMSPFSKNEYHFVANKPDFALMNRACELLLGSQDFTSFSKVKTEVNNFICEISTAKWEFSENKAIFHVTANRFLRGMVRAMVGTLLDIGYQRKSIDELKNILTAKDRSLAGQSVPPQGLYLCKINYPPHIFIN